MPDDHREELRQIKSFPSLVKYLRDKLDWPIDAEDFDDLTFDYEAEELGLDAKTAAKIDGIKQLRPLVTGQPWGIFFVKFEPKRLPVVALRRILGQLVFKKRASASRAERPAWDPHDLLFISAFGEGDERQISFAHFSEDAHLNNLATLRVLGWDGDDTGLHLDHVYNELHDKLRWPADTADVSHWRRRWSLAFTLRHREVIVTSKDLATELAELARKIRRKVNAALRAESANGKLRKLMRAFQESLIHDLDEDDFADMYAQTTAYGLLSARVSRQSGALAADDVALMAPVTSPFLRELMETFLNLGGRKRKANGQAIDFDELGIADVVEMLRAANMEAVLRDFDNRNPQEDPVVHFYELFLKEYDAKKRMQRGVFYTPKPVVSYIVRSVHELLQTEFGLPDGLADTTTWGEMAHVSGTLRVPLGNGTRSVPDTSRAPLAIPEGVSPDQPFVQILDPALGTGTFLVEVIEVIHATMTGKWRAAGHSEKQIVELWNDYVPTHLLPRLYGFELLMAPYAIAHMKIGLKLAETGYRFQSDERARVYLTNSLEPAMPELQQKQIAEMSLALAHEAQAVNVIKRHQRFTVVIGNPPYSGVSANMTEHAQHIVDAYKIVDGAALNERKLWLQDDYVKFIRTAQATIEGGHAGVLGYVTNHGYLDNPTFRGMRQSLMGTFAHICVINLHGNANKKEESPDGSEDKNVFDIRQGVAICLATCGGADAGAARAELWGTRESKYSWLAEHSAKDTNFSALTPDSPFYFLERQNTDCRAEYDAGWKITDIFPTHGVGVVMARDSMTVDFDADALWERVKDFASLPPEDARTKYRLGDDARDWRVATAQADVQATGPNKKRICSILYRPFDDRFTYYTGNSRGFYASPCRKVMRSMVAGDNRGLVLSRSVEIARFSHVFCTNGIIGHHSVSLKEVNYLCPLWVEPTEGAPKSLMNVDDERQPNLAPPFLRALGTLLLLTETGAHAVPAGLTPKDVFDYAYAVLHSPGYRSRYAEFLKVDFPRLPLTGSLGLFRALAGLGTELAALHLLESPRLDEPISTYKGPPDPEVGRVTWSAGNVWIDAPPPANRRAAGDGTRRVATTIRGTVGFCGVPETVWSFHIGGYQVCEKWLKDRKGRILSNDDIAHYQKIVVALAETIRLMKEIDAVIDKHGGWPGAFAAQPLAETDGKPPRKAPSH